MYVYIIQSNVGDYHPNYVILYITLDLDDALQKLSEFKKSDNPIISFDVHTYTYNTHIFRYETNTYIESCTPGMFKQDTYIVEDDEIEARNGSS